MDKDNLQIKNWFLWLMLFIVPPFGIILIWLKQGYKTYVKLILSGIFIIYFIVFLVIFSRLSGKFPDRLMMLNPLSHFLWT